jgi:nicotinamidase-related amidase
MDKKDFSIDVSSTALVLIDLQMGIVARPGAPRPAADVVANAARLADAFRQKGAFTIFVHVAFKDPKERLVVTADSMLAPAAPAPNWADFVPELNVTTKDHVIVKHQWGSFYGTDLDLQLRRRKIKTLVLGGIATNYGVESTARDAYERGYEQIFVEDAMTGQNADALACALEHVFKRMGRVRSTAAVLSALK